MFNPKHACLRGGARRKADTTQAVGEDIINLVATFASCRDLCTLGCVCLRFAPLPGRESLWELRALDILPSRARLRSAMSELRITSYRQLVDAFTKIGIPAGVLGFWQAEKPYRSWAAQLEFSSRLSPPGREGPTVEEEEAKGELLRISLAAGRFQCDSIAPNGTSRCIFTIRVLPNANQTVSIHFFSMEGVNPPATPFTNWIPGQGSGWVPVPTGNARTPIRPSGEKAFFLNRVGGRTCRFIKLKAPTPPSSTASSASAAATLQRNSAMPVAASIAQNLCGLWSAPYGSHGLEIIQLSLNPCSAASGAPPPSSEGAAAAGRAEMGRGVGARAELSKPGGRSTATFSSSGKTSSSESVCTSAPATDSSEGGLGGSCGSVASGSISGSASASISGSGSDDSGAEEEDAEGGRGKMFRSRPVRRVRARAASSNEDGGSGSETDEEDEERNYNEGAGGGERRTHSRFVAGSGAAAASVSGRGDGDAPLRPQLIGVKVTGDANVPAGKTSFAIDLEEHCDVDAELEADRRPVVLFLPSGALMANLANRRGQISFWRKGRGQINRVPGRWSPEWVDVDFVVYKAGFNRAFSVVFRQPTQAVRVMMDFERALGSKEEWPQWPASAASVQCRG